MSNPESWKSWEGGVVGGKFPLRQWLGGSDHSAVFLTDRHGHSDQKAAIKLIAEIAAESERQRARWRAAAQLLHPNLIQIDEIGRCQMNGAALLYVVMEFAEEDLSQILPQRALAASEVTEMLPPLLDSLSYLHSKGLVHTRIKPSNVLAVGDLLKLSIDQATAPIESGDEGTRRDVYDAPETGAGIVSPAGDMWSLGATLVEALTQKPPFSPETAPRDRGVPGNVPEPFRGIARECLHDDPKRRCSIADVKARMQPAARSVPDQTPLRATPTPRRNDQSWWRLLIPIVILLIFVVGVRALYKAYSQKSSTDAQSKTAAAPVASEPENPNATSPHTTPPAKEPTAAPAAPIPQSPAPPKKTAFVPGDVLLRVVPDVPRSAKDTISGTIRVEARLDVDASGKVSTVKLTSAGPSKYFAGLAEKAAKQWLFSPLGANGKPSESTWLLKFYFQRTGTQVDASQVSR